MSAMASRAHLTLFILLASLSSSSSEHQQRFLPSTLQLGLQACNKPQFCPVTLDVPLSAANNKSCCRPCSCQQDCWLYDDCCPDIHSSKDSYKSPYGNISLSCSPDILDIFNTNPSPSTYYKMITKCPDNYTDDFTRRRCEEPFGTHFVLSNISLNDVVVVSGPDDIIFKTVFCAKCHGISNVKRWSVRAIVCANAFFDASNYFDLQMTIEYCNLVAYPPADVSLRRSICYNNAVSICPPKNFLTAEEEDIINACNFSVFPVSHKLFVNSKRYGNVFCLLCNQPTAALPIVCDPDDDVKSHVSYTTFISFASSIQSKMATFKQHRCPIDEVFDDNTKSCRRLICPFGTRPEYEACVYNGFVWYHTPLLFPVTLNTPDYIFNTVRLNMDVFGIGQHLLNNSGLAPKCNICESNLIIRGENQWTIHVYFGIILTNDCTFDMIKLAVMPLINTGCRAVTFISNAYINVSYRFFQSFVESAGSNISRERACGDMSGVRMNKLFHCPHVIINESEYCNWLTERKVNISHSCLSQNDDHLKDIQRDVFYVNGTAKIRICLDTYISRFRNISSNSTRLQYYKIVLIGLLVQIIHVHQL